MVLKINQGTQCFSDLERINYVLVSFLWRNLRCSCTQTFSGDLMKVITRAAISGKIATIKNGKRIVQKYESGEKLNGVIVIDDTPKYTGYVRDYGKQGKLPQF